MPLEGNAHRATREVLGKSYLRIHHVGAWEATPPSRSSALKKELLASERLSIGTVT
jgi:hypothetical protein